MPGINPDEQSKHKRHIELLADEMGRSIADVEAVYKGIVKELEKTAKVRDFLPVIAWRRAKEVLRRV